MTNALKSSLLIVSTFTMNVTSYSSVTAAMICKAFLLG
jgi:hypothetical protein